jgi:hypothetical protein
MPKLETFSLEVTTGTNPGPDTPHFSINGFPLQFEEIEGSTEPGDIIYLVGETHSFPHSLTLAGPETDEPDWDIDSVSITYNCANMEPYTINLGKATLDDHSDLNIWHEAPPVMFDV